MRKPVEAARYCADLVGLSLRQASAVNNRPQKDIDLCLRDSATFAAFQRKEKLWSRFSRSRAERAWVRWTHNFSRRLPGGPRDVLVDRQGGVFKEEEFGRFGCLVDIETCLYKKTAGTFIPFRPVSNADQLPDVEAEIKAGRSSFAGEPVTVRKAIIEARRGQGEFREKLECIWKRRCAVTGCRQRSVLRAAHIKPWRESSNRDRLNPFNGLLLAPNLDAAFDRGLISFRDDGRIVMSIRLSSRDRRSLGIHTGMKLSQVFPQNEPFLAHHRRLYGFPARP